jgi:hypothetical protein
MAEPTKAVELNIINAFALDPGKVYLFQVDRKKVSRDELHRAFDYLHKKHGINGAVVWSAGGDGIQAVTVQEPQPAESTPTPEEMATAITDQEAK